MKKLLAIVFAVSAIFGLTACATDAETASYNVSQASDMFEVQRRVVFLNGITDEYILEIEGLCSIEADMEDDQLEVVCKTGPNTYKKHFLGLSDNVTYFLEQLEPVEADIYHYRVVFKPSVIIPDIEVK